MENLMARNAKKTSVKRCVVAKIKRQKLYDPRDFLSPRRIDIAAKTIFARAYLENNKSSWPEHVYREHIRAFNNFHENKPKKDTYAEFKNSFIRTIEGVKNDDSWKSKKPVLKNKNGLVNGAHRVATSIVLSDKINTKRVKDDSNWVYNHAYFKEPKTTHAAIDEDVLDYITIEYVSLKRSNIFIAIIFPSAEGFRDQAYDRLSSLGEIVNMKSFKHDEFVGKEVIKQLYFNSNNDEWNQGNDFESAQYKADLCFAGTGDLQVYVIESNLDETTRVKEKQYLRNLWQKDKHSIHITDTIEEANRVVRMFFNKNSREFMKINRKQEFFSDAMANMFNEYIKLAPKDIVKRENIAIEGSAVLDLCNLRAGRDIDYISRDDNINFSNSHIEKHDISENKYHAESIDEILTNPKYYFYYKGYKFITVKELRDYKKNRLKVTNDKKDSQDIKLIDNMLAKIKNDSTHRRYPLVSIIVPVYNTPKNYLQPALQSIAQQVYPNIEIILVDDGSDKKTSDYLDQFAKSNQHKQTQTWTVIHQDNKGLSGARNAGYEKASGEYIQFLDADDYFDERLVSSAVHRALQTSADIVVENFTIKDYDTDKETVVLDKSRLPDSATFGLRNIEIGKIGTIPFNVWSKLFKKSFLEKYKLKHDETLKRAEDVLFSYSALVNTDKITFLESPYIVYRENLPQSNTKNNDTHPAASVESWKKLCSYLKKRKLYSVYEKDFIHAAAWSLQWHLDRLKTEQGVKEFAKEAAVLIKTISINYSYPVVGLVEAINKDYGLYEMIRGLRQAIDDKKMEIDKLSEQIQQQTEIINHLNKPGIKTSSRKLAGAVKRRLKRTLTKR